MRQTTKAGAVALVIIAATVGAGTAGPAHAAAKAYGYVWGYQPAAANYQAISGYEYNSAGGAIHIQRSGVGDYRVRFVSAAAPGAIAHASAYGSGNSSFCTIAAWAPSAGDELLRIRCFDGAGAPVDSRFVASFTNAQSAGLAYAFSDDPAPVGWYEPATQHDALAGIQVSRIGVGRYLVDSATLSADGAALSDSGYLRASAYGVAPVRCEILDPAAYAPALIPVRCYDINGGWVDSRFTVSYSRTVNQFGQATPYGSAQVMPDPLLPPTVNAWTNPGGAPTAIEVVPGTYQVTFPGLGHPRGHATANVFGTPPQYCTVAAWWSTLAGDEVVTVQCYDADSHEPTEVYAFDVSFTH